MPHIRVEFESRAGKSEASVFSPEPHRSLSHAPDRIVLLPGGKAGFVEVKAPGKKPRPLQARRKKQLEQMGFKVFVLDGTEQIGGIIDEIRTP